MRINLNSFPTCWSVGTREKWPPFERAAGESSGESQVSVREKMGMFREEFKDIRGFAVENAREPD